MRINGVRQEEPRPGFEPGLSSLPRQQRVSRPETRLFGGFTLGVFAFRVLILVPSLDFPCLGRLRVFVVKHGF